MSVLSRFYEDIEVGEEIQFGSRVFDTEGIKDFARKYDPQPFHVDEDAAKNSHFGALCASGWQTASAWMRFYVDHNMKIRLGSEASGKGVPQINVSPGMENLKWMRPVYVGDEVNFHQIIAAKRPLASRPGWGLVTSDCGGRNQKGEAVISFVSKNFVQMRES